MSPENHLFNPDIVELGQSSSYGGPKRTVCFNYVTDPNEESLILSDFVFFGFERHEKYINNLAYVYIILT